MARGDQLVRQWKLLHILAARGRRTVEELMQEVHCSRRTIWRDLAVLQAAGFPLTTEQEGRENRYRLIEGPQGTPPLPFTLTELMSLYIGRHLLVPLRGTPVGEAIHTVLDKVAATLGPAAKAFLDRLDRSLSARAVQAKDSSRASEMLRLLQQALQERRTVEADYHSFGRDAVSHRRLDPLHLWYQQGGIYLAAYCHTRRQVLTFALERFRQVRLTEDMFQSPPEFNLDRYLEGSFGLFRGEPVRVSLRFSRQVARYVAERQWHPSQALSPLLTGELEMILRVPLSPELRRWILGYGKDVEVLEPKSLREDIRREWLAALRGTEGRVEALRLTARKARPRPRATTKAALAPSEGTRARTRRAVPGPHSKQ
jgi:predicted DNA-binding transcriptional regulator YafY